MAYKLICLVNILYLLSLHHYHNVLNHTSLLCHQHHHHHHHPPYEPCFLLFLMDQLHLIFLQFLLPSFLLLPFLYQGNKKSNLPLSGISITGLRQSYTLLMNNVLTCTSIISFVHDLYLLQSNQVKCAPQRDINELII